MTVVRGQDVQEAARWLMQGQLVAFPTETVYGLGANARDEQAIAAVYRAKGRPGNHPVIVHVTDAHAVSSWAASVSKQAQLLMEHFWPGPLTLILPKHESVSLHITGGQDTVAVRCPEHPIAQQLLRAFEQMWGQGAGVIAPSANRFGQVSPTHADHVYDEFSAVPDESIYLLEGEESRVGIESTIVDLSRMDAAPRILRPGQIHAEEISQVLGVKVYDYEAAMAVNEAAQDLPNTQTATDSTVIPRVSGSLKAHYAPRTPLYLFKRTEIPQLSRRWLQNKEHRVAIVGCGPLQQEFDAVLQQVQQSGATAVEIQNMHLEALPNDAIQYAQRLYATLRRLDRAGFDALWFERPPQEAAWGGINDRLSRAAAAFA